MPGKRERALRRKIHSSSRRMGSSFDATGDTAKARYKRKSSDRRGQFTKAPIWRSNPSGKTASLRNFTGKVKVLPDGTVQILGTQR